MTPNKCSRLLAGSLILDLLAACSSVPNQTDATISPAPPRPGYASLYVGRPPGRNVSIFPLAILVDGNPLMSLAPGQYTTVELPTGKHSIAVPDETWTRAIAGNPHPAEFVADSGKIYYALPTHWYTDGGYRTSMVGSIAVSDRTAVTQNSFTIQTATAKMDPPADFSQLTYVKAP
jgi:hypothetical protein